MSLISEPLPFVAMPPLILVAAQIVLGELTMHNDNRPQAIGIVIDVTHSRFAMLAGS